MAEQQVADQPKEKMQKQQTSDNNPRSDPKSPEYDPVYARDHPVSVNRTFSLSDLNAFKMDLISKIEQVSSDVADMRQNGADAKRFDNLQQKVTVIRSAVHGFYS